MRRRQSGQGRCFDAATADSGKIETRAKSARGERGDDTRPSEFQETRIPNVRDNLSLYLLTALVAIVCIASVGQAVGNDATPVAGAGPAKSATANDHREKLHEAQVRDAY